MSDSDNPTVEVYIIDRKTGERLYEHPQTVYLSSLESEKRRVALVKYRTVINLDKYEIVPVSDMPNPPPFTKPTLNVNTQPSGHVVIGPKDKKISLRCNFNDIIGLDADQAISILQKEFPQHHIYKRHEEMRPRSRESFKDGFEIEHNDNNKVMRVIPIRHLGGV
jgi:hypothetical protein